MKKTLITLCTLFAFIPICLCATDFSKYANRVGYNQKKYDSAVNPSSAVLNRYKDKYLKDLFETNYAGISTTRQQEIKTLRDTILSDDSYSCYSTDSEDMCKLRKFHDWIKENFYYYNPVTAAGASELGLDLEEYDNPYFILTKNKLTTSEGTHYIARCNGYASVLIALARNEGLPARNIDGYYNTSYRRVAGSDWPNNVEENKLTHYWVEVYVDGRWVIIDANADSYNAYSKAKKCSYNQDGIRLNGRSPGEFTTKSTCEAAGYSWTNWTLSQKSWVGDYDEKYFDISIEDLSDSHIIFGYRPGSRNVKYATNIFEDGKMKTFLNKKYGGKTNGAKINSNYSPSNISTWFASGDTQSKGYGNGRFYKIYWPANVGLWGKLDLSGFTSLQNLSVSNNLLTSIYCENCTNLSTVAASKNKLIKVVVTGSAKLKLLSIQSNPTTYVEYQFTPNKRTAIIKAGTGGTVSVKYSKTDNKYSHLMTAVPKTGYKFVGWYNGSKKLSSKASITSTKSVSFTYVAKFAKK